MSEADWYPFSLDRRTETAFLRELELTTALMLWRADEIEAAARSLREYGLIQTTPTLGRYSEPIPGHMRVEGAIEAFLAAWARASLILFPIKKGGQARGRHLRALFDLNRERLSFTVEDRALRNGWMHLDEDLDHWSLERSGQVAEGHLRATDPDAGWLFIVGAIRVVSLDPPRVRLPRRGAFSLRPYFHRAKYLHERVTATLNGGRWIEHREIEGLAAGRPSERGQQWEVRSLGRVSGIVGEGSTYPEAVDAFKRAVDERLSR